MVKAWETVPFFVIHTMKSIVRVLFTGWLVVAALNVQAAGVNFFDGSYSEALAKAKTENRLLFIDFRAHWCKPCLELEQTTFKDSALGVFMDNNFVAFKADVDFFYGMDLQEQYNVNQYPTMLVVNTYEEVQLRIIGFRPADVLQMDLEGILKFIGYGESNSNDTTDKVVPEQNEKRDSPKKRKCLFFRKD